MECKNTIFAVASAVKMSQNGDFFLSLDWEFFP